MNPRTAEDCDHLFERHLNAGNVDALIGLYEPGATLVNQDGSLATGPTAIRAALAGFLEGKPNIRMHIAKTVPAGDGLVLVYNDWTLSMRGPDGAAIEMTGKALELVRRQADGSWRFAVDDPFARG
jgi:uncharacterized protein (TIGR02246 family)